MRSAAPASSANRQPREVIHYLRPGLLQVLGSVLLPSPPNLVSRFSWADARSVKRARGQVTGKV
jgi:hypothetical protein